MNNDGILVAVNFKNKHGDSYGAKEYHYRTTTQLEVGQLVRVQTKNGESQVRVARVGVPEDELPDYLRNAMLKTITGASLLLHADGSPCMDRQQQMDFPESESADDEFFK